MDEIVGNFNGQAVYAGFWNCDQNTKRAARFAGYFTADNGTEVLHEMCFSCASEFQRHHGKKRVIDFS